MKKTLLLSISLMFMLSFLLGTPVYALEETELHDPSTNQSDQLPKPDENTKNEPQEKQNSEPSTQPDPTPQPKSEPKQDPPSTSNPKEEEQPPKDVYLTVLYQLNQKFLIVKGMLNQEIDSGVFNVTFQGKTKQFEGPGNSFTAQFPRSEIKPGTHTLTVSFRGLIGDQVVSDTKKVRIIIPQPKKISLSVTHKLNQKSLTVHGKLNRKVDSGVFNVTFQGKTKQFEGPGNSFTAHFPRSGLKPGTHTLTVSFRGLIGNQIVSDTKKVRVTIPQPKKISLSVTHKLNQKSLTVHGKLNRKIDSGVFNITFQGKTKRFEGPGNSFTAHFPRSGLKPGTHTLTVSFRGLIGDQVVSDTKKVQVTIPAIDSSKKVTIHEKETKATQKKVVIGGPLPKTATNLPLLILSGFLLMGVGITVWWRRKKVY